ncbi:hypothetical protein Tco_1033576 [Tanacetum coccineum]
MPNNSQGKKQEVEDHHRKFKFSNNKTSVTACNDSLNAKTSNVNFVCVTYGKCVLNDNHDLCVLHYINGVNSRTRQPMAVPVSTTEPKHNVNKSVATSHKKTVATDSTVKKPRNIIRKLYEQLVEINLSTLDTGAHSHDSEILKLQNNFVEKFLGTLLFRKSTCYIRDLKGNDLLTGSLWHRFVFITPSRTQHLPNPICLMPKATRRKLGYGIFGDKAKKSLFHTKTTQLIKDGYNFYTWTYVSNAVESINGKKFVLAIVDDYSDILRPNFLRAKDETPGVPLLISTHSSKRGLHAQRLQQFR